jgi:ATP-dependent Lon protease
MKIDKSIHQTTNQILTLPVIPTMDVVVFPNMIVPLLVLDERIVQGINAALESESKMVLLLASRKESSDHQGAIGTNDLYTVGTIASVMRLIKIPEGGVKVLVQGVCKGIVKDLSSQDAILNAEVETCYLTYDEDDTDLAAHIKNIKAVAEQMAANGQQPTPDFHNILSKMNDPAKIADFIISNLTLSVPQAQKLLESTNCSQLFNDLYAHLAKEIEVSQVQERIKTRARDSMNNAQKEFYLREQLKAIKQELGDDEGEEIEQLRAKLESLPIPEDSYKEINRQINRLEKTSSDSMEAAVLRTYIDWTLALPWGIFTQDNLDLTHAQQILDEDHYGLEEIKDRILDFISIRTLKGDSEAPILCLSGPPGTGKTSLGKSIARALGRKYHRIALGGIKDEAEIRGHRRTYVGSMPGRFIQAMRKAGSMNPVIIIDELDKIGNDFRGDPSAAMLEVLDPQQNKAFYDNYLGIPFDLSQVIFIATANDLSNISRPLRDRMEVIQLSGYSLEEKCNIAEKCLIKHNCAETGLTPEQLPITRLILSDIIYHYTRESGVRELNRQIRKLCSKEARSLVEGKGIITFTTENLDQYLGPRKFLQDDIERNPKVGISNGLAWTSVGGEMIKIEVVAMPGTGKLLLTGQLGDVMKESAQAALSYARAHAREFSIDNKMFTEYDLHIHIPAGGTPKDGPSAGVTMLSAILSALTQRPINAEYAMTGEINLQGNILPIGGVKEKILAAKQNKIPHVLLPAKNKKDIMGIEPLIDGIKIIWVDHADDVLKHVLLDRVIA